MQTRMNYLSLLMDAIGLLDGTQGAQLEAGAALNALVLIDFVLLIPRFNTSKGAVSEAAATGDALGSNYIHAVFLLSDIQIGGDILAC